MASDLTEVQNQVKVLVKNNCTLLSDDKMHLPGAILDVPSLSEADQMLVQEFGIKRGVDIVTASFVRRPEDIEEFRKVLDEKEQGKRVQIFAKI